MPPLLAIFNSGRDIPIQGAVHIHPTVSELVPTMLGDLKPLE